MAGASVPTYLYSDGVPLEDGLTHLRVRESVRTTERLLREMITDKDPKKRQWDPATGLPFDTEDPWTIIRALIRVCKGYTLTNEPRLAEHDHSGFWNRNLTPVGAWPILQYIGDGAQCQAIVRLVRAMAMAIGLPGKVELVVVYALLEVDGGKTALVDSMLPLDQDPAKYRIGWMGQWEFQPGLHHAKQRTANDGVGEVPGLADRHVDVGDEYPLNKVFNAYEACLRYTRPGIKEKPTYFGGGVPDSWYETPEEVLHIFHQLVWTRRVDTAFGPQSRVVEIVADYRKGKP